MKECSSGIATPKQPRVSHFKWQIAEALLPYLAILTIFNH